MNFLDYIESKYGKEDAFAHSKVLQAFGYEDLQTNQWVPGNRSHAVFLNECGTVIKCLERGLAQDYFDFGDRPYVLKPTQHAFFEQTALFFLPGLSLKPRGPTVANPVDYLYKMVSQEGLFALDIDIENIAFLTPSDICPLSLPVIIDHGCIRHNLQNGSPIENSPYEGLQETLFAPFIEALGDNWEAILDGDQDAANEYKGVCRESLADEQGILCNGWLDLSHSLQTRTKPARASYSSQNLALALA